MAKLMTNSASIAAPLVAGMVILNVQQMGHASPILDKIRAQAQNIKQTGELFTADSGRGAFSMSSVEGYPGESTSLKINTEYEVYEDGARKRKEIARVNIDWGDGSSSTSYPGFNQNHTYGKRDEDGDTSPSKNTRYEGRITFFTTDGKSYTEGFDYEVWVNRRGSLARGGREVSPEIKEPVWCINGAVSEGICSEDFEVEQVVFEYEGCYDHNLITFPVLYAPKAVFDVRGQAVIVNNRYNAGWHVRASNNEIENIYSNGFRVQDYKHGGNVSGIYYYFDPINPGGQNSHQKIEEVVFTEVTVSVNSIKSTYAAQRSLSVYRQPTEQNGWKATLRLEDLGTGGGSPPCPVGGVYGHAWAQLSVVGKIKGTVRSSLQSSQSSSMPAGSHHNPAYQRYLEYPQ